jgi:hypothetical protein
MRQKTELEITLHGGATGEARSVGVEGSETRAAKAKIESRTALGPLIIHRTAVYGPVRTVVWEGAAARPTPIPISDSCCFWDSRAESKRLGCVVMIRWQEGDHDDDQGAFE